jgi:hypothetical protein
MQPCTDDVVTINRSDIYCMAKADEVMAIYLIEGGTTRMRLPEGNTYSVAWYDALADDELKKGSIESVQGIDGLVEIGMAPTPDGRDWLILLRKID